MVNNLHIFESLPSYAQYVAQVYGVLHPVSVSQTNLVRICSAAQPQQDWRRFTNDMAQMANRHLVEGGLIIPSSDATYQLRNNWALVLTQAAFNNNLLESIWQAFDRIQPHHSYFMNSSRLEMLARYSTVTQSFRTLESMSKIPDNAWSFLAYDETGDYRSELPEVFRKHALSASIKEVIENAIPSEKVISEIKNDSRLLQKHAGDVAFIYLLKNDFESARKVFSNDSLDLGKNTQLLMHSTATEACIATMEGNDPSAVDHIEKTIRIIGNSSRKKYFFPNSQAFCFALLSFIRLGQASNLDRLKQILRGTTSKNQFPWLVEIAQIALATVSGTAHPLSITGTSTLQLLVLGYTQCWSNPNIVSFDPKQFQKRIKHALDGIKDTDYTWLNQELHEVAEALENNITGHSTNNSHVNARSFVNLIQPQEDWEMALSQLERLAFKSNQEPDIAKENSIDTQQRLVWELDLTRWNSPIQPKIQKLGRNGWSKGKEISKEKLLEFDTPINISDKEHLILRKLQKSQAKWESGDADLECLYALIGAENVISANGIELAVVERAPELNIRNNDEKEEVLITLEPYGDSSTAFAAVMQPGNRCEVTQYLESHKALRSIIPSEGLILPQNSKNRLMEAIQSIAQDIRIQSNIDADSTYEEIVGSSEICVQLMRSSNGLTVNIVVEPVDNSGIYFSPGDGGSSIYFPSKNQKVVIVKRRLYKEHENYESLLESCPTIPKNHNASKPLSVSGPTHCLELIQQLQNSNVRCQWPNGQALQIAGQVGVSQLRISIKSASEWFQASAEVKVDENKVLNLKQIFELVDAQPESRFLELDDGRFIALTETFKEELDKLRTYSIIDPDESIRIDPSAAGLLDSSTTNIDYITDVRWEETIAQYKIAQDLRPIVPKTLLADLRPYQIEGFEWLVKLATWTAGGVLADDMGLGKTVQALALLLYRSALGPALVVAPTSVVNNWIHEAKRFAPTLNIKIYAGDPLTRRQILGSPQPNDLFVTTYGILQNDIEYLSSIQWGTAVLDEAQAIKNITTKRARSSFRLPASFRLLTTGTPIQNNLMDLYSLFRFVNPGILGSTREFQRRFVLPIERDEIQEISNQLSGLISPFILRRLKKDVLKELPPRTEITLSVELSEEEQVLYEALRQRAMDDINTPSVSHKGEQRIQILAHITRLRLACCNPQLVQSNNPPDSSKLRVFEETLLELLEGDHKVLVFSQFVKHLKIVENKLSELDVNYQYLDGKTPRHIRQKRIDAFQKGQGDVFLISLTAGGTGLNLTAADYVFHLDPWWNPAVEDQASDRAHRIGQRRPVTIYRFVARNTIEDQIVELHQRKRALADSLLTGSSQASRLNAEELIGLIRGDST